MHMWTICVDAETPFVFDWNNYALASGREQEGKNDLLFLAKSGKRWHQDTLKHIIQSV